MPSRQEKHANAPKPTPPKDSNLNSNFTFHPEKPRSVPNFKKKHEKLSKKFPKTHFKENKPKTETKSDPPSANPINSRSQDPYKIDMCAFTQLEDTDNNQCVPPESISTKPKKIPKVTKTPLPAPRFTQKAADQISLTRENFQKAKEAEAKEKSLEAEKQRRLAEKAAKFREKMNLGSQMSNSEKLELLTQKKVDECREREAAYKAQLKALDDRLESREVGLAQQPLPDVSRRQQMLSQIQVLMKTHDVFVGKNPGQDLAAVFSKEELKLIQEGKYLRKHGYLK